MKKILSNLFAVSKNLLIFGVFSLLYMTNPSTALAADCGGVISGVGGTLPPYTDGMTHTIKISLQGQNPNQDYRMKVLANKVSGIEATMLSDVYPNRGDQSDSNRFGSWTYDSSTMILTWVIKDEGALKASLFGETDEALHQVYLYKSNTNRLCRVGEYGTPKHNPGMGSPSGCTWTITQRNNNFDKCYWPASCMSHNKNIDLMVEGLYDNGEPYSGRAKFKISSEVDVPGNANNGIFSASWTPQASEDKNFDISVVLLDGNNIEASNCEVTIKTKENCLENECSTEPSSFSNGTGETQPFQLCAQINDPAQYNSCIECAGGAEGVASGVWTAVGCIPTNATSIVQTLIKIGLSVAGGVALLMILAAGFIYSTSQGDPKRTNEAKELMTSAIIGLLFIIFSVTMLQFIGVSVLHIPGFGNT